MDYANNSSSLLELQKISIPKSISLKTYKILSSNEVIRMYKNKDSRFHAVMMIFSADLGCN